VDLRYPATPLRDEEIEIRRWRSPGDLECVRAASSDPHIPQGTTVPAIFSRGAGLAFLDRQHRRITNGEGVSQAIVERATGRAVGLIIVSASPDPHLARLGYWIIPERRRCGLGRRAVSLITTWALRELGVRRLEAWVAPDNLASQTVLVASGFRLEGRRDDLIRLHDAAPSPGLIFARHAPEPPADRGG
jgi:[ribosomal protein S5]-alanine N-acetyltransferase